MNRVILPSLHDGPGFSPGVQLRQARQHIATVDVEGVAFAAIPGLNRKLQEPAGQLSRRDAEIQNLRQPNCFGKRLENLEHAVESMMVTK
jgi:hypothetical protein